MGVENKYNVDSTESIEIDNDFKYRVNFINKSTNDDPKYATSGSAGFDLRSNENVVIKAGKYALVSTGLYFELPPNMELQVRSRSGLAAKFGVAVLNSPGTVDSDYRGEVKVILINHGEMDFNISKGDRIAQAVVAMNCGNNFINLNKVNELNENTDRGSGGFGSTGLK